MLITLALHEPNASRVELLGELPDWSCPHPFASLGAGHFRLSLEVAPGTYLAKVLVDGQRWRLLPGAPVDRLLDDENSILVVGGIAHPVVFGPCRRHWVRPVPDLLFINTQMAPHDELPPEQIAVELLSEQGKVLNRTHAEWMLPVREAFLLRYRVKVPPGAYAMRFSHAGTTWVLPAVEATQTPDWLKQGCIYAILVDRWYAGSHVADPRASPRSAPSTRTTFYGGTLEGVLESVDYVAQLGATAIALSPVHFAESPHRYDAQDLRLVDPRLGGESALRRLIDACHERGLAVILDAAFTHCHANHFAFRDVLLYQASSAYADWFQIRHFPVCLEDPDSYRYYWQMPHLPLTNLMSPGLQEHVFSVFEQWQTFGVDGIRLDAADMAPNELWAKVKSRLNARAATPILLAESVTEPAGRYVRSGIAQSVYDFPLRSELIRWFASEHDDFSSFCQRVEAVLHQRGPVTDSQRLLFLDSHDTNRFVTEATFYWRLRLALLFLLERSEPIWLYYGTELALTSRQRAIEAESAWADRLPMPEAWTPTITELLVRKLLKYRKRFSGRGFGEAVLLTGIGNLIAYERHSKHRRLVVVLNFSERIEALPSALLSGRTVLRVSDDSPIVRESLAPHEGRLLLWRKTSSDPCGSSGQGGRLVTPAAVKSS